MVWPTLGSSESSNAESARNTNSKLSSLGYSTDCRTEADESAWDTSRTKDLFTKSTSFTESTSTASKSNVADTNVQEPADWALSRIRYSLNAPTSRSDRIGIAGSGSTSGCGQSHESNVDESTWGLSTRASEVSAQSKGATSTSISGCSQSNDSDYRDESTWLSAQTSGVSSRAESASATRETLSQTAESSCTWSSGWSSMISKEVASAQSFDSGFSTIESNFSLISRLDELSEPEHSAFDDYAPSFESEDSEPRSNNPLQLDVSESTSFQHGSSWSLHTTSTTFSPSFESEFFPHADITTIAQAKSVLGLDKDTDADTVEESTSRLSTTNTSTVPEPGPEYTYAESIFQDESIAGIGYRDVGIPAEDASYDSALSETLIEAQNEIRLISLSDFQNDFRWVVNDLAAVFSLFRLNNNNPNTPE
mmetsp:Transcript_2635/g.3897  ORF Transcript_2635/g.3897 Transcript_2635/m.3897 type:complete len:423 (+) Transcript_2635:319-1587(+)|eukprot:CAMPEP_0194213226 /NCGR_PEP_ID=MMETSP0156-20130528/13629_1 /TAXON_ID=33649 /ORGANISM="Thalassionema nitzschioides, Strain L26-B" /LENGTH=422 /DNA_ID=CAMNT_0038941211 /DNA_START=231 /DNA_END=1499 /DNA_ORIENTATION=-